MAKLPKAKMEAGENPARSRHCKEGAFSDSCGNVMQGAGHFHKTTEGAADKPQKDIALGKVRKRDERRVRRHAQIWTPIPGIVRVQGEQPIGIGAVRRLPFTLHWYLMREDRENKQRKRAAVSRQLAGHDSSFFCVLFSL